jgi:acylphosphatase
VAKRVRVLVTGRVQGVFYRTTCASRARQLGLAGSVRNLPDGRVEAVFEGRDEDVDVMVEWCRNGPDLARVDALEIVPEPLSGDPEFRVTG